MTEDACESHLLDEPSRSVPPTPAVAVEVFGDRLELAERYTALLAGTGVEHGLIGPREVPRLWERHVLNCAVLGTVLDADSEVVDVGSGAGLPGLVLAIVLPQVRMTLVEPMARRVAWLENAARCLELEVRVVRGRAEDVGGEVCADVITSRAVSRLANLAAWCAPLAREGTTMLAIKGTSATEELARDAAVMRRHGWRDAVVEQIAQMGRGVVDPPTTVVRAVWSAPATPAAQRTGRGGRASRRTARRG